MMLGARDACIIAPALMPEVKLLEMNTTGTVFALFTSCAENEGRFQFNSRLLDQNSDIEGIGLDLRFYPVYRNRRCLMSSINFRVE